MKNSRAMRRTTTAAAIVLLVLPVTAQPFDVDTIMYNGPVDTFINIVVLGDGYLESELDRFSDNADSIVRALFLQVPFNHYKECFNVFTIRVPSNESGAATHPDSLIDNYFGSTFRYADIEWLLVPTRDEKVSGVLANHFPAYDQVIMLVNSPLYGGSGGWVSTASSHPEANEIAFHEMGHSFAGLADEYWAGPVYAEEKINMTRETDLEKVKWRNWYGDKGIGLYPHEEAPEWHRPHQGCKMRYLGQPFCSVCIEGIVERIHSLVSPILSHRPVSGSIEVNDGALQFRIHLLDPSPNTLRRKWELNGTPAGRNTDTLTLTRDDLVSGANVLAVTVEDTTSLLRVNDHETFHLYTVSWSINLSATGFHEVVTNTAHAVTEIYPNPTSDLVHIRIISGKIEELEIGLFNLQGKKLSTIVPAGNQLVNLNLQELPPGTYLVRISRDGIPIASRKIVKI